MGSVTMLWFHLTLLGPHLSRPCHVVTPQRDGEMERKKEESKDGEMGEVIVADLGWTEDVFLLFSTSHENILTK